MPPDAPLIVEALLDRKLVPTTGGSDAHFGVRVQAPAVAAATETTRPPLNLALVLDRSGSMARGKLDRAREATIFALRQLTDRDTVGIVAYDDVIELVMPSQPATPAAKRQAEVALTRIAARGNTNLHDGWLLGLQQIASQQAHAPASALHRCFLLTDGLANQGITDHDTLVARAKEWRARDIATTTFGVGADFDEHLLEDLATAGGGHFYFIAEAGDIPAFFRGELGELLTVAARAISLDLWAVVERPGATEHASFTVLNRLPATTAADGTVTLDLGELDAEGERVIAVRVACPRGSRGEQVTLHARLRYASPDLARQFTMDLPVQRLTYDLETAVAAQPVDPAFMNEILLLQAAAARDEADAQMRAGDVAGAVGTLRHMSHAMFASAPLAGYPAPSMAEAAALEELAQQGESQGFSPLARKQSHARAAQLHGKRRDYASQPPTPPAPSTPPQGSAEPPATPEPPDPKAP
jgi:Ca-activated chloride channel family protein